MLLLRKSPYNPNRCACRYWSPTRWLWRGGAHSRALSLLSCLCLCFLATFLSRSRWLYYLFSPAFWPLIHSSLILHSQYNSTFRSLSTWLACFFINLPDRMRKSPWNTTWAACPPTAANTAEFTRLVSILGYQAEVFIKLSFWVLFVFFFRVIRLLFIL